MATKPLTDYEKAQRRAVRLFLAWILAETPPTAEDEMRVCQAITVVAHWDGADDECECPECAPQLYPIHHRRGCPV